MNVSNWPGYICMFATSFGYDTAVYNLKNQQTSKFTGVQARRVQLD